ncbi:AI-2E family transporter [Helicobacter pullorum]|uniref:Putative acid membrane antigen A n=1 Tax=Helicobacter pullorum TaxID=35818 RepID=A0A377PZE3_9HELI|nr:AI-2E family transporter [Helicobacter pullorum]STQ87897.1 putative acid membrane antigen A [Helicobacter pullorum]
MVSNSKGSYFFLVAFVLTLLALLKLYSPFLMNLLIAFLLFIATQSIFQIILKKIKSEFFSSLLMTLLLLLLCFMPIFYVAINLASFATNVDLNGFQNIFALMQQKLINFSRQFFDYLPSVVQQEVESLLLRINSIDWAEIVKKILGFIAKLSANSIYFVSDAVFIVVFLFFFYFYGNKLGKYFIEVIPIDKQQIKSLYDEVSAVISVVFYSSILSMVLQGMLFGILMTFYGYNAILLGVFYGFASLIPVVGGTLVWLPVACYELYLGNFTNAIIITLYSIIVIATIADNGVKPFIIAFINRVLIEEPVKINEMLIFFAIIAGLSSFGFWGIVLGPAITALFIAMLRIYQNLYKG